MTKTHQIEIESVILFIISAGIGAVFALYLGHKPPTPNKISLPVMQTQANPTAIPTPTLTPPVPKPQTTSQLSPDGTKLLTMAVTTNKDLANTYTFTTTNADNTNQQTVYTATNSAESMSIPFNTWSPDDRYIFLTKNTSAGPEALVVRADGQPLTDTEQNVNAHTLFLAKNTANTYQETTGWASDTLLIMNTTSQDSTKGPSYWLEIPSKAIIQLSTEF